MESFSGEAKSLEIKKHVSTIHCRNSLSLVQRKVWNALLYNAYYDLKEHSEFKIPLKSLCELINYRSNDYKTLKNAMRTLMQTVVEWDVMGHAQSKSEDWSASTAIASVRFSNGVCIYEYSKLMRELLYNPSIYGRLDMKILSKFSSSYGIALYENCMRYQDLPNRQTGWISLDVLRVLLGVEDDKYTTLYDFKRRVLNPAVKDFNKNAPWGIDVEMQKHMGKVSFRFRFCPRIDITSTPLDQNNELVDILIKKIGCTPEIASSLQKKYDTDYILEKLNLVTSSFSYTSGKIQNLVGYFLEALQKNYQPSRTSKETLENARGDREEKERLEKINQMKYEEKSKQYALYARERLNFLFENMDQKEKENINSSFILYLEKSNLYVFADLFKRHGYENDDDVVRWLANFIKFNFEKYRGFFESIEAF